MTQEAAILVDLALLLVAAFACFSRKVSSLQLVIFWVMSCALFECVGSSVMWFAAYSTLCMLFAFKTRSVLIAGLFVAQVGACGVVTFEWAVPGYTYVYDSYSWIIGVCFLLQIGVAAIEQGNSFSCSNHRDLLRALRSSLGAT